MSSYTLTLTPSLRNLATDGSLDTAILNGVSIQRTGYIEVVVGSSRKIVTPRDGGTFDNTTLHLITTAPGLGVV